MSNNRRNNFALSSDQRILLETYVSLFNQTNAQMDSLREIQRGLIQDIRIISNLQNNNERNTSYTESNHRNGGSYYLDGRPLRFDFYSNRRQSPGDNNINFVDTLWNNFENLYSNIVVRPTPETIENATRNIRYSQIITPLNSNCPISLEPFSDSSEVTQILGCRHIFHTDSLNVWFERNVRCPVCRYDIRDPINTNQENLSSEIPEEQHDNSSTTPTLDPPNNDLSQGLTNLTEIILNRLLNPGIINSTRMNRDNTRVLYDPSNNEIIF